MVFTKTIILILSLALIPSFIFCYLDPSKVVYAIDAGAEVDEGSAFGFTYKKDEGFSNSKVADYRNNQELARKIIQYTFDQQVFFTERHSDNSFSYQIPVLQDGTYVLVLQFCEMYFKFANKRVFNIKFGNKRVLEGIDVVAKAGGPYTAHEEYVEFELKEGQIYVKGQQCQYGYVRNNLFVEFEKTDKDNPIVNGLVLVKGTLSDTLYHHKEQFRKEWKTKLEEEQRKQEEEKKRKLEEKKKLMESIGNDGLDIYDTNESTLEAITRIMIQKEGLCIIFLLFTLFVFMHFVKDAQIPTKEKKN